MWRVWGRGEGCTGFWWGNLRERDHWGDPDADGRIILRWMFRKWEGVVGTGWSWLRIGHLWVRWWTFGFQKHVGISWLAAEPVSFSRRTLIHGVCILKPSSGQTTTRSVLRKTFTVDCFIWNAVVRSRTVTPICVRLCIKRTLLPQWQKKRQKTPRTVTLSEL